MVDCYIGEIRLWSAPRIPEEWHVCDGSTLPIASYNALYALIGTIYGGDGVTTFGLPDLRGRLPIGIGQGPNLTNRVPGEKVGTETVTVTAANLPAHTHPLNGTSAAPTTNVLGSGVGFATPTDGVLLYASATATPAPTKVTVQDTTIGQTGGNGPHANTMQSVALNYIIALTGLYPQAS